MLANHCRIFGIKCRACMKGFPYVYVSMHHIRPRRHGGGNEDENLMPLCDGCHNFIEEQIPLPHTLSGVLNALEVWLSENTHLPKSKKTPMTCFKHGDWKKWVYGGVKPDFECRCSSEAIAKASRIAPELPESDFDDPERREAHIESSETNVQECTPTVYVKKTMSELVLARYPDIHKRLEP